MGLGQRRLRGVRQLVEELDEWVLDADEWGTVGELVEQFANGVRGGDREQVTSAQEKMQTLDRRRRVVPARPEARMPITEEVRERRNVLVHEIEVLLVDDDDGRPDDAG